MSKKGFSLVELAVVLVIIGLLIAMAIKAYSMVVNARTRQHLSSIDKIATALNNYYSLYGILPGDNQAAPAGIIALSQFPESAQKLIQSGLLDYSDFRIEDNKHNLIGYWRFNRCSPSNNGYEALPAGAITIRGNICLGGDMTYFPEDDLYGLGSANASATVPENIMAGYELYMDNSDITSGLGRARDRANNFSEKQFMSMLSSGVKFDGYLIKIW